MLCGLSFNFYNVSNISKIFVNRVIPKSKPLKRLYADAAKFQHGRVSMKIVLEKCTKSTPDRSEETGIQEMLKKVEDLIKQPSNRPKVKSIKFCTPPTVSKNHYQIRSSGIFKKKRVKFCNPPNSCSEGPQTHKNRGIKDEKKRQKLCNSDPTGMSIIDNIDSGSATKKRLKFCTPPTSPNDETNAQNFSIAESSKAINYRPSPNPKHCLSRREVPKLQKKARGIQSITFLKDDNSSVSKPDNQMGSDSYKGGDTSSNALLPMDTGKLNSGENLEKIVPKPRFHGGILPAGARAARISHHKPFNSFNKSSLADSKQQKYLERIAKKSETLKALLTSSTEKFRAVGLRIADRRRPSYLTSQAKAGVSTASIADIFKDKEKAEKAIQRRNQMQGSQSKEKVQDNAEGNTDGTGDGESMLKSEILQTPTVRGLLERRRRRLLSSQLHSGEKAKSPQRTSCSAAGTGKKPFASAFLSKTGNPFISPRASSELFPEKTKASAIGEKQSIKLPANVPVPIEVFKGNNADKETEGKAETTFHLPSPTSPPTLVSQVNTSKTEKNNMKSVAVADNKREKNTLTIPLLPVLFVDSLQTPDPHPSKLKAPSKADSAKYSNSSQSNDVLPSKSKAANTEEAAKPTLNQDSTKYFNASQIGDVLPSKSKSIVNQDQSLDIIFSSTNNTESNSAPNRAEQDLKPEESKSTGLSQSKKSQSPSRHKQTKLTEHGRKKLYTEMAWPPVNKPNQTDVDSPWNEPASFRVDNRISRDNSIFFYRTEPKKKDTKTRVIPSKLKSDNAVETAESDDNLNASIPIIVRRRLVRNKGNLRKIYPVPPIKPLIEQFREKTQTLYSQKKQTYELTENLLPPDTYKSRHPKTKRDALPTPALLQFSYPLHPSSRVKSRPSSHSHKIRRPLLPPLNYYSKKDPLSIANNRRSAEPFKGKTFKNIIRKTLKTYVKDLPPIQPCIDEMYFGVANKMQTKAKRYSRKIRNDAERNRLYPSNEEEEDCKIAKEDMGGKSAVPYKSKYVKFFNTNSSTVSYRNKLLPNVEDELPLTRSKARGSKKVTTSKILSKGKRSTSSMEGRPKKFITPPTPIASFYRNKSMRNRHADIIRTITDTPPADGKKDGKVNGKVENNTPTDGDNITDKKSRSFVDIAPIVVAIENGPGNNFENISEESPSAQPPPRELTPQTVENSENIFSRLFKALFPHN